MFTLWKRQRPSNRNREKSRNFFFYFFSTFSAFLFVISLVEKYIKLGYAVEEILRYRFIRVLLLRIWVIEWNDFRSKAYIYCTKQISITSLPCAVFWVEVMGRLSGFNSTDLLKNRRKCISSLWHLSDDLELMKYRMNWVNYWSTKFSSHSLASFGVQTSEIIYWSAPQFSPFCSSSLQLRVRETCAFSLLVNSNKLILGG